MKKPQSSSCVVHEAYYYASKRERLDRQTRYSGKRDLPQTHPYEIDSFRERHGRCGPSQQKLAEKLTHHLFETEGVGAAVVEIYLEDVVVCSSDPLHRVWSTREHWDSKGEQSSGTNINC